MKRRLKRLVLVFLLTFMAIPALSGVAEAQEERSIGVVCVGQVLNLPFIDIPEDTILLAITVTDGFKCPSQGRFT